MPLKFEAAILRETGQPLCLETVELMELGPHDVLVRIEAAGLCHTDLEAQVGSFPARLPMVLGHEGAGTVEDVGCEVTSVHRGQKVVCALYPSCGRCFYCRRGQFPLCEVVAASHREGTLLDGRKRLRSASGEHIGQFLTVGSFGEYAVLPEQGAIPVPGDIPSERACLIACGVPTGFGAVTRIARVRFGSSVAVIGCGPVGLSAIQGARAVGASVIIAVDPAQDRLRRAEAMGATESIDAGDGTGAVVEAIRSLTDGRGADYVFEAAGRPEAFQVALDAARPGADVVFLGKIDPTVQLSLTFGSLMGEKRVTRASLGGGCCHDDFPAFAKAYMEGTLDLDSLVTHGLSLSDINQGFEWVSDRTAVRAVITPGKR